MAKGVKDSYFRDPESPRLLARRPIIGLIMFVVGILIFVLLAYNFVNQGPLIKYDIAIAESFHSLALRSSPLTINLMVAGYHMGIEGIAIFSVILGLYFLYKKFWRELIIVISSIGISGLIFIFVSNIFKRSRPFLLFKEQIWPDSPNIPGFPSGHTLSIVVFCGLIIYLLLPKIKSHSKRFLIILFLSLLAIYIGFSRLYIGDHYLTDIIAGYAIGIAWFGLTVTLVDLLFQLNYLRKKRTNHGKRTK